MYFKSYVYMPRYEEYSGIRRATIFNSDIYSFHRGRLETVIFISEESLTLHPSIRNSN